MKIFKCFHELHIIFFCVFVGLSGPWRRLGDADAESTAVVLPGVLTREPGCPKGALGGPGPQGRRRNIMKICRTAIQNIMKNIKKHIRDPLLFS